MIPPEASGDFVAAMEDILDIYKKPYDHNCPVICMDEQPIQLTKETRVPIPAQPGTPERHDYEYERCGTAVCFMFTEVLAGWRKAHIKEQRTAIDWTTEIRTLLEDDYPEAKKVIVVCDNLNTHKTDSLYKAFSPDVARTLSKRLEIHYTPKHGNWLNIAEIELSVFIKQCLQRRIPSIEQLDNEAHAWALNRNASHKYVNWHFTTHDARVKLARLYPEIQMA